MAKSQITTPFRNNSSIPQAGSTYNYTLQELQEFMRCSKDPVYFIKTYMRIVNVDRGLVPFDLYPYQEQMIRSYHENRFNITLTSRQAGKSTTVIAFFLHYILFNVNINACISANKQKLASELLGKLKIAYENLPRFLQQGVSKWAELEIELENGSRVFASATSSSAVRGGSYNCIAGDSIVTLQDENGNNTNTTISQLKKDLEDNGDCENSSNINTDMLKNKYTTWYFAIVNRALSREWKHSTHPNIFETHHIIPRSCGGLNNNDNLVKLTYREHFLVHKLLTRMYEGKNKASMLRALFMMANTRKSDRNYINKTSKEYSILRAAYIATRPIRVVSAETRQKISVANKGRLLGKHRTPESIEKYKKTVAGRVRSQEHTDKINKNPEKIRKMAETHRGMKRTEESKKTMSEARKNYFANGGASWNVGKKMSPEYVQNCKDAWVRRRVKAAASIETLVTNENSSE